MVPDEAGSLTEAKVLGILDLKMITEWLDATCANGTSSTMSMSACFINELKDLEPLVMS